MNKINKHTVLKQVRQKGQWIGYISPSNINVYHVNNGWNIGHEILIFLGKDKNYYVLFDTEYEKLEDYLNNYKYYNCNSELGKRISFWENKER